jgi:hypothetical protein
MPSLIRSLAYSSSTLAIVLLAASAELGVGSGFLAILAAIRLELFLTTLYAAGILDIAAAPTPVKAALVPSSTGSHLFSASCSAKAA